MSRARFGGTFGPVPGYGAGNRIERVEPVTPWHPVISRAEARREGRLRYFTGKPRLRGHVCERRVSDWTCLGCDQERWHARIAHPGYRLRKALADTHGYMRRHWAALEERLTEMYAREAPAHSASAPLYRLNPALNAKSPAPGLSFCEGVGAPRGGALPPHGEDTT